MKKLPIFLTVLLLPAGLAQKPSGVEGIRFRALDVFIDTGEKSLAAWQIEITGNDSRSKIVGVEGGEVGLYSGAPYYDPAALQGGRIIIAAFRLDGNPPAGRIRVARLHMAEPVGELPGYSARIMAAATRGGERIDARVELKESGGN